MYKLEITVEATWRGKILDTVKPVCTLSLSKVETCPTAFNLDPYYRLNLHDGDYVDIGCSWTKNNEAGFQVSKKDITLLSLRTKGEFDIEVVLNDGLQYQFKLTKSTQ